MQTALFEDVLLAGHPLDKIVNVASVPQRSPFRYPGGKTWLIPHLRRWLMSLSKQPALFIEPFAGGGICSLTVAAEGLADHVVMVELDSDVAAVWETIFAGDGQELARRVAEFDLTAQSVQEELAKEKPSTLERAFQTILRNRVNRGGILAPGVGRIKEGENGKGLLSRWYPETLRRRIEEILVYRDRITFIHGDAFEQIELWREREDVVFFMDPPYTAGGKKAGSRLYAHSEIDHERLFTEAARLAGDFLLTYDNATDIKAMARRHGLETRAVAMKSTHHAVMTELLIGRNLAWVRSHA